MVIGDSALDVSVRPSQPMRPAGDVPAAIHLAAGGQGANVAVRLARAGETVTLLTGLADDAAGGLLRAALGTEGVRLVALPVARSTTVVVLLDVSGERSMLSDRATLRVPSADALAGAEWIHCSGYPLLDDESGDVLGSLLGGRSAGVRLSVAGGSVPPDPVRVARLRRRLEAAHPDLLVVSRQEAASLLGTAPVAAPAAADALLTVAPVVVVTEGAAGSAAATAAGQRVHVPAAEAAVVDTTGSGDAYTAALLARLARGPWPPDPATLQEAMTAAGLQGARVAGVLGAQGRVEGEA